MQYKYYGGLSKSALIQLLNEAYFYKKQPKTDFDNRS